MKTKNLLLLFILTWSFQDISAYQSINWEFVNSFSDYLTNVYTQGEDTVYVVGQNGLVAQSPDRGKTWYYQHIITETLNDVYFTSHNVGFIVGTNGTILKTIDAGMNWTSVVSGTTQKLNAISAIDINNIWAVGDNGTVIKSTDGGQIWNAVSITTQTPNFSDIGFKNTKGYIIGNMGSIYQTLDNGSTWVQQTNIEGYTGQEFFQDLSITENNVFVHMMRVGFNGLFINAGTDWNMKDVQELHEIGSLYFFNDQIGYYTTTDVSTGTGYTSYLNVYKTTDGGNNWTLDGGGTLQHMEYGGMYSGGKEQFAFSNSTLGYLISGIYMYRTPYVGDIIANTLNINQEIILKRTGNILSVNCSGSKVSNLKIVSMSGQTLFSQTSDLTDQIVVNIDNLDKGIYIVQIKLSDNTTWSKKYIKL